MNTQSAIQIINWAAKEYHKAQSLLEDFLYGDFPEPMPPDEESLVEAILAQHGINLHLAHNRFAGIEGIYCSANISEDCCSCCDDCPYAETLIPEYLELEVDNADKVLLELKHEADYLYNLKQKACKNYPTVEYQKIGDAFLKVVNVDGYRPHIPVSFEEESKIIIGELEARDITEEFRGSRMFHPFTLEALSEAKEFLERMA